MFRPCRRADLIGFWGVVRFGFASGARVDRGDPDYQPYQRYVFNADETMAYAATDVPPTSEQQRTLLRAPGSATWAVDGRGRLMRQAAGSTRVETSECRVITRAVRDPRQLRAGAVRRRAADRAGRGREADRPASAQEAPGGSVGRASDATGSVVAAISVRRNTAPPARPFSAVSVPRSRSAIPAEMASPRPVAPVFVV